MKFLICGLGSIGQRHYRNLKALGQDEILVYRTGKGTNDFVQKFVDEHAPVIFTDLGKALECRPDAVIVSNPTARHVPVALEAARAGCHLFIEKPISNNWTGLNELRHEADKRSLVTYIAYNLRFHPFLRTLSDWLANELVGKPVSFHAEMAERVNTWHPWEDYRVGYAARQDLGGGVVLTQSHELDYLYWLFGPVERVAAIGGKLGDLEMDVEDVAKMLLSFQSGLVGSLDIDYLKNPPKRSLEVVTTRGRIFWDYFGKKLDFIPVDQKYEAMSEQEPTGFERNQMFIDELNHFRDCVAGKIQSLNPLESALKVFRILLAVKESLVTKTIVTPLQ